MITNSNRSGFVRVEPGEDRAAKPVDDKRSGRSSDKPEEVETKDFGPKGRKKIIEKDGRLQLVDA